MHKREIVAVALVLAAAGVARAQTGLGSLLAPTGLAAPSPTNQAPQLTWNVVAGAGGYGVFRNGKWIAHTTTNAFTDSTLSGSQSVQYQVHARDGTTISPLSTPITVVYDVVPPSVPANLSAPSPTQTAPQLSWSASTDDLSGVAGYTVFRDGASIGNTTATSLVDVGTVGGTHTYSVLAFDTAGNASSACAAITVVFNPAWTAENLRTANFQGCIFGAHVAPTLETITQLETNIGRKIAVSRNYYGFDSVTFPTSDDLADAAAGRLSLDSIDTDSAGWTAIASGKKDATIHALAGQLKSFGKPIFIDFGHEPELVGTNSADYVAAYRRIVTLMRQDGATNVIFCVIFLQGSWLNGKADLYYPGDDVIDWIGSDGYNWFPGIPNAPWTDFQKVFTGLNDWGTKHGKPLLVGEFGCQENPNPQNPTETKPQWIKDAATTLQVQFPSIRMVCYFNSTRRFGWYVETSPASQSAFSAMGAETYFNPVPR